MSLICKLASRPPDVLQGRSEEVGASDPFGAVISYRENEGLLYSHSRQ